MDLQSRKQEFRDAWAAFSNSDSSPGWRTIPISSGGRISTRAGRKFPENLEAIFFHFSKVLTRKPNTLPKGKGFEVVQIQLEEQGFQNDTWIALVRNPVANSELFIEMTADVAETLSLLKSESQEVAFATFVDRIAAWQDFMQKDRPRSLSPEEETGLWGELTFLKQLIDYGAIPTLAVEAWKGPLDSPQDFIFEGGAVEVKSTIQQRSFIAKISSLKQLDINTGMTLFLFGYQLRISEDGKTLGQVIEEIRNKIRPFANSLDVFNVRLIRAGYLDSCLEFYQNRLQIVQQFGYLVEGEFPRVTKGMLAEGVVSARYEIDLGGLAGFRHFDLSEIAQGVGVR